VENISENLEKLFYKEVPEIKIAHRMWKSNASLFSNMKDRISTLENSNVVYKVECNKDTCNASYIGHTSRLLKYRLKEHETSTNKVVRSDLKTNLIVVQPITPTRQNSKNKRSREYMIPRSPEKYQKNTALKTHAQKYNHTFNILGAKVLQKEKNLRKRLILESIEIIKNNNACNTRSDTDNISESYMDMIKIDFKKYKK